MLSMSPAIGREALDKILPLDHFNISLSFGCPSLLFPSPTMTKTDCSRKTPTLTVLQSIESYHRDHVHDYLLSPPPVSGTAIPSLRRPAGPCQRRPDTPIPPVGRRSHHGCLLVSPSASLRISDIDHPLQSLELSRRWRSQLAQLHHRSEQRQHRLY